MKHLVLSILLLSAVTLRAQLLDPVALDSVRTYRDLERALREPLLVQRLDLSGAKLKSFPEAIRQLPNLNALEPGVSRAEL